MLESKSLLQTNSFLPAGNGVQVTSQQSASSSDSEPSAANGSRDRAVSGSKVQAPLLEVYAACTEDAETNCMHIYYKLQAEHLPCTGFKLQ